MELRIICGTAIAITSIIGLTIVYCAKIKYGGRKNERKDN